MISATPQMLYSDHCRHKHGGAETSVEAFERLTPHLPKAQMDALEAVRLAGDVGLTLDELADQVGKPKHAISGRISELLASNRIEVIGKRRNKGGNKCRIYKAK